MSTGARLQQEREKRSVSLDEMARTTQIDREHLEALEQDAFDRLRGPAFGKLYIRAYAEKLGFDPAPLLEAYDRERRERAAKHAAVRSSPKPERIRPVQSAVARWREARIAELSASGTVAAEPAEPEPVEAEPLEPEPVEHEPVEPAPSAAAQTEPQPEPVLEPEPEPPPLEPIEALAAPEPAERSPRARRRLAFVAIALMLVVLTIRALRSLGDAPEIPVPVPVPVPAPVQPVAPATIESARDVAPPERTVEPPPKPRAAESSHLRVTESAVGRRLDGRVVTGGRLRKGQVAAFETRVVGGRRGDKIRHVWKWGGRTMQTISLQVGSSQWRTFSTKTLNGPGAWTVEAQDASGSVLAHAELVVGE